MTYLFKLATMSEAPHATPPPRLRQPMRARRTWRAFFAMTSSLLWDDVKFKMDGITTSAKKALQHARKVAAVWWKRASKTKRHEMVSVARAAKSISPLALNRLDDGSWRHLAKCEERAAFSPFLPDVTLKGWYCAAIKHGQFKPAFHLKLTTAAAQATLGRSQT